MPHRLFGALKTHAPIAIAIKSAVVILAVLLLVQANMHFPMGSPLLLAHAGVLATVIGGFVIWPMLRRSRPRHGHDAAPGEQRAPHIGITLHSAGLYDLLVKVVTFGHEHAFRERMLGFASLKPGEDVLDVGCGTGTLALLAKRKVGAKGRVEGIDAAGEMIARATKKARRAGLDVAFSMAPAQKLPFADGEFDVVLGTLMFHHLPKTGRMEFAAEALRVLRPGGRLFLVDFAKPPRRKRIFRLHRHGHVDLDRIAEGITGLGFTVTESGDVGSNRLRYLVARPTGQGGRAPGGEGPRADTAR